MQLIAYQLLTYTGKVATAAILADPICFSNIMNYGFRLHSSKFKLLGSRFLTGMSLDYAGSISFILSEIYGSFQFSLIEKGHLL